MAAIRASLHSFISRVHTSRRQAAELRQDRLARVEPGPTPSDTTFSSGIHPSVHPTTFGRR